jgi:hypothetical protein
MYPDAIVNVEAITIIKRLKSNTTSSALFSGAIINIADKYCARAITGML